MRETPRRKHREIIDPTMNMEVHSMACYRLCYLINSRKSPQYTMTFFITLQFLCLMASTQIVMFTFISSSGFLLLFKFQEVISVGNIKKYLRSSYQVIKA